MASVLAGADAFLNIRVHPAAGLGKLEEVLVITQAEEKVAVADQTTPARAADILARRLPSRAGQAGKRSQARNAGAAASRPPGAPATVKPGRAEDPCPGAPAAETMKAPAAKPAAQTRPRPKPLRQIHLNSVPITYTSGEQVEVYRFRLPVAVLVPLAAIFLQAFLPLRLPFFSIFDLPLLVTLFFAVARRSQGAGIVTGAVIGLVQDSLTHQPIGIYGIAKTVVGYGASSLGVKLDVENAGARFLVTLFFYVVHEVVYFYVARGLVGLSLAWSWPHELGKAFANAILAVPLFFLLDRFKQKT